LPLALLDALDGARTVKNGNAHARFAHGTGTMSIMAIHLRPKQWITFLCGTKNPKQPFQMSLPL
jgi:hypothetical protein